MKGCAGVADGRVPRFVVAPSLRIHRRRRVGSAGRAIAPENRMIRLRVGPVPRAPLRGGARAEEREADPREGAGGEARVEVAAERVQGWNGTVVCGMH